MSGTRRTDERWKYEWSNDKNLADLSFSSFHLLSSFFLLPRHKPPTSARSTVWLDPQEAAEIGQANSRSGVRKLLKDGHM